MSEAVRVEGRRDAVERCPMLEARFARHESSSSRRRGWVEQHRTPLPDTLLREPCGCHDLLADASAGEPVPCPRCGTAHHRACAEELLRCSVLGCGGALAEGAPEGPRTSTEAIAERLRRRVRERAAALAEGRGPPPPPRASDDEPDVPQFGPVEQWGDFARANPELALLLLALVPVLLTVPCLLSG